MHAASLMPPIMDKVVIKESSAIMSRSDPHQRSLLDIIAEKPMV
jgi:hypothetical protein